MSTEARRVGCLTAAVSISAAIASSALADGKRLDRCRIEGSRTEAQSKAVRVYSRRRSGTRHYYGCVRRTGRRPHLGPYVNSDLDRFEVAHFRAAGPVVAYRLARYTFTGSQSEGASVPEHFVVVRDLVARKVLHRHTSRDEGQDPQARAPGAISDLVVTTGGSAAWIVESLWQGRREREVHVAAGADRVRLDAGTGIDPRSLVRRGRTIAWRHGGVERTAELDPRP